VFKSRFDQVYSDDENASLEVRCAFGTPAEIVFQIPIRWLTDHVLVDAHSHDGGRYMFSVNPQNHVFTWDYRVEMNGEQFRVD